MATYVKTVEDVTIGTTGTDISKGTILETFGFLPPTITGYGQFLVYWKDYWLYIKVEMTVPAYANPEP